jgi:hypothetical protein
MQVLARRPFEALIWCPVRRVAGLVSGLLLLGCLVAGTARADALHEPEGYRVTVEEALAERELGHYLESRVLFAKAHALFPSARTLRGLGLSDYDLRDYPSSIRNLEASLASTVRPLEGALRSEVESVLAHAYDFVGRYTFSVSPASAELRIGDALVDPSLSTATLLPVGPHLIRMQAAGYSPLEEKLIVRGGEQQQLSFVLQASKERAPARADTSADSRPWYKRGWVWATAGAIVVGAATAAIVIAKRDDRAPAPAYGGSAGVVIDVP